MTIRLDAARQENGRVMRRWSPVPKCACRDGMEFDLDSHRLEGDESLSARPARKTSLFGKSTFGGPTETKKARSVVALSRDPPLRRGSPVRLRLPVFTRRLTGLLSGSPPTDTRPQARAKLGNSVNTQFCADYKDFLSSRQISGKKHSPRRLGCNSREIKENLTFASMRVQNAIWASRTEISRNSFRAAPSRNRRLAVEHEAR